MDAHDFSAEKELLLLCLKNKEEKANNLIEKKDLNLNWENRHGETAIYFAARHNSALAMTLLQKGADPTIRTRSNQSILHQIGISGNLELLQAISERGDMKRLVYGEVRSWDGLSPVHLACKFGHKQVIEEFQAAGLSLNIKSWSGGTALHYSLAHSHFQLALYLLDQNASVNSRTYSFGFTLKKPHSALHILMHWPDVNSNHELYEKVLQEMIFRRARIRGCRSCKAREPCNLLAAARLPHYTELKAEMKPANKKGSFIGIFKKKKVSTPYRDNSSLDDEYEYDDDDDDWEDLDEEKLARLRVVDEHNARS